ncbi:hypothetical protein [Vagococcus hydrophili]|uniref:Addiction module toxin RelE n=1 Tax=Vagococcus hydrophili TaxID=2714947 RepID=A0A6G8AR60_9ENTE|nr:hypothetical protein [Vagococcus hydrophili]QIL47415.1 hypothetical protein G7082_02135 [Vagococcus hydrophili]
MEDKTKIFVGLTDNAKKDFKKIDGVRRKWVIAVIKRVEENYAELKISGVIEPLEDKNGINLKGYYKLKNPKLGVRMVLSISSDGLGVSVVSITGSDLEKNEADLMASVVAIDQRKELEVYKQAAKRIRKKM